MASTSWQFSLVSPLLPYRSGCGVWKCPPKVRRSCSEWPTTISHRLVEFLRYKIVSLIGSWLNLFVFLILPIQPWISLLSYSKCFCAIWPIPGSLSSLSLCTEPTEPLSRLQFVHSFNNLFVIAVAKILKKLEVVLRYVQVGSVVQIKAWVGVVIKQPMRNYFTFQLYFLLSLLG